MDKNIHYVAKRLNQSYVTQFRPIENFWDILSQQVYEGGQEATNEHQLIRQMTAKLSEIDLKTAENLEKGVKGKLESVFKEGVFSENVDFCVEISCLQLAKIIP